MVNILSLTCKVIKSCLKKCESFYFTIGSVCGIRLAGSLFKNVESLQSYKDFIETLTI
ncbi:hypothetical protein BACI71_70719 [Bacillus mycoides]|uniref:Uncharacterized protein n=1 Tax=Bacillus mycoides TaxID=1405 RepID=A0A654BTB5_BACMY|nr:hypothetical protein BACI71_70719 [Bacillus mycoides]